MNTRYHDETPAEAAGDGWIDSVLSADAASALAGPEIADDGFTNSLMAGLPAHRTRASHRWIVPAMGVIGFVAGLGLMSGGEELTLALTGLAQMRAPSMEQVLLAALPLAVLYWIAFGAAWQEA